MIKKRGMNLKRELTVKENVKKELEFAGVPDIHDLGLKPVKRDVKDISKSVNNTIFKKAGKKLQDMVSSDYLKVQNVRTLKDDFKDNPKEYETVVYVLHQSLKKEPKEKLTDEEYITGEVVDLEGNVIEFVTIAAKDYDLEFKSQGLYSVRRTSFSRYFISFSVLKGLLFLFKAVGEFLEKDSNVDEYLLYHYNRYKMLEVMGINYAEDDLEEINYLSENFKSLEGVLKEENFYKFGMHFSSGRYIKSSSFFKGYDEVARMNLYDLLTNQAITLRSTCYKYTSGSIALTELYSTSIFLICLDLIITKNLEEERRSKELISSSKNYAKSFETKMNIPEQIQEKMKTSKFLSHFDYVEYDELVDMDKIDEIEDEWERLKDIVVFPSAKGQNLRFRRLGHHKAAGLYYPYQESLCVDIRTTSSFVHEYFHLVDYTFKENNRRLSASFDFIPIINKYKEIGNLLLESPEYEGVKSSLTGKYGKEYYFSEEEIFARCGELYLRNVDSHLLGHKVGSSPFYPDNDELFEMIDDFYSNLDLIVEVEKASVEAC